MVRAWHLACARDDVHRLGLRVPAGMWLCERCHLALWDEFSFAAHAGRRAC